MARSKADATTPGYAARLLAWFDTGGRHDLPWQHPRSPYRVWLSEVMLQQTQVKRVIPYFQRFAAALPDLPALAAAPLDQVLSLWSGLGYYSRARNLHRAAQVCMERHGGELPRDVDALAALPGIGRSTAAAIASQAWNDRHAILDGNVKRVLARWHGIGGWPGLPAVERELWRRALVHVEEPGLPQGRLADYTQAQMDLGATICTRHNPACAICPLQADCVARIEGRTRELPAPRPAKALPEREAWMLVLRDDARRILLQRRPPAGVWASLWTPPQFDDRAALMAWLAANVENTVAPATLEPVEHGFSHYRLRLHPLQAHAALKPAVRDDGDLAWVDAAALDRYGLPSRIRRMLDRLLET